MSNAFAAPHFYNDDAARTLIESVRWPDGPVCSHCGTINHSYAVKGRAGLYRCAEAECRKDFTCTTGTIMERSKIPLHKWMMGFYLMSASKKGVSAHQLHRALAVTYPTAWFMCHRIREAMRDGGLSSLGSPGGSGIVEADETYFGDVPETRHRKSKQRGNRPYTKTGRSGIGGKRAILAPLSRGVRFPVQSCRTRLQRYRPHQSRDQRHRRQAPHLSSISLSQISGFSSCGLCGAGDRIAPSCLLPSSLSCRSGMMNEPLFGWGHALERLRWRVHCRLERGHEAALCLFIGILIVFRHGPIRR